MEVKGEESWKSEDNLQIALGPSGGTEKDKRWHRLIPVPSFGC